MTTSNLRNGKIRDPKALVLLLSYSWKCIHLINIMKFLSFY